MKLLATLAAATTALNLDFTTIMMMQQMNGGQMDLFSNPLLMFQLLDSDSTSSGSSSSSNSLKDLLPLMLMQGGNMGNMGPLLPFLLMDDSKDTSDDDLFLFMMLSQQNGGAAVNPLAGMNGLQDPALASLLLGRK